MVYRGLWSTLAEARVRYVVEIGLAEDLAEERVKTIVRDGALPGSDPEGRPRIRLNHDEDPWVSNAGPRADPWSWLRGDPQLDFERSMILRPVRRPEPRPQSITQETLIMYRRVMMPGTIDEEWDWQWTTIEIRTQDLDRILAEERADSRAENPRGPSENREKAPEELPNDCETAVEEVRQRLGPNVGIKKTYKELKDRKWTTKQIEAALIKSRGRQKRGRQKS
jgi:hypothetical protein